MEATTQTIITIEQAIEKLKAEYPRGVELYYVDYGDNLNYNSKVAQDIIETGYTEEFIEGRWDTGEVIGQHIEATFTDDEQEAIYNDDELHNAILDWLYDNNRSDPLKDLVRNTNDTLFLVDLEFHFDSPDRSEEERIEICKEFLKHIGQEVTEKNLKQVHSIYCEAYYGGTAYAMIQANLSGFYGNDSNHIELTDLKLGIIDTYNGSGDFGDVDTTKNIVRPRKDIVLDASIDYGVNSIFGGGIEGSDGYKLKQIDDVVIDPEPVQIKKDIAEEEERKKEYQKTGCAGFGCHKIKYHTTYYQNEPMRCGLKCEHCNRLRLD